MTNPNDYIGETITVLGTYYVFPSEEHGRDFHYIITKEGDACCMEGFEFVLKDGYAEPYSEIEITGVFDSYDEDNRTKYYLAVDDLSVI